VIKRKRRAGKIRTFGQYTIGDILEERYGPLARIFGAIALIISFTVIVSYQFVAGGFILNVATDGAIPDSVGTIIAAAFVILFTAVGGMIAVAYTDLPNGIIIILACLLPALTWKRVTKAGGLASIISGTTICVFLKIIGEVLPPDKVPDGDPWGIPIIYPALIVSVGSLIVISLLTKKQKSEEIEKFFPLKK